MNKNTPAEEFNNYQVQPIPNLTDSQAIEIYRRFDYQQLPNDIKSQVLGRMCFLQEKFSRLGSK